MNVRPLSRAEVRSIDVLAADEYGLATIVLMENAGREAAAWLKARLGPNDRVLVVCGPGNNGGDGGVLARHLDAGEAAVRVVWLAPPEALRGETAVQHRILRSAGIEQSHVDLGNFDAFDWSADWLVDGLLGTGLTRPVEGLFARAVREMNDRTGKLLALDLPSGLDADEGTPLGVAVRADATVTFVAPKLGFERPEAAPYLGETIVADIGLPRRLLSRFHRS